MSEKLTQQTIFGMFGIKKEDIAHFEPQMFRFDKREKSQRLDITVRNETFSGFTLMIDLKSNCEIASFSLSKTGMPQNNFPRDQILVLNSTVLPDANYSLDEIKEILSIIFLSHINNPLMGDETVIQMIESIAHQLSQSEVVV